MSNSQLTKEEFDKEPWLHIYASGHEHCEVLIEGTREALTALRDGIDRTLKLNQETTVEAFVADGEGYGIEINIRNYDYLVKARYPYYKFREYGTNERG